MQRNINYTFETQDELLNSFSVLQIAQLDLLGALIYSSDNLVVQKASSDDSSEPGTFLPIVGPLIDVILSLLRSAGEGSGISLPSSLEQNTRQCVMVISIEVMRGLFKFYGNEAYDAFWEHGGKHALTKALQFVSFCLHSHDQVHADVLLPTKIIQGKSSSPPLRWAN